MQETIRISFGGGTYSLGNLLPNRFKPADLLEDPATPLLLQPQDNAIALGPGARAALEGRAGDAAFQRAAEEALAEAVRVGWRGDGWLSALGVLRSASASQLPWRYAANCCPMCKPCHASSLTFHTPRNI